MSVFGNKKPEIVCAASGIVAQNMRDLMFVLDNNNTIAEMNSAAMEAAMADSSIIGKTIDSLGGQWPELLNRYNGIQSVREQVAISVNNHHRLYDLSIFPVTNSRGRKLGRLIVMRDLHELKTAEEEIRKNEDEFRTVIETASDAIVIADHEGNVVLWGKASQAVFGYSTADITGQPLDLLAPERFRKEFRDKLQKVALGELDLAGTYIETMGRKKDGSEIDVEFSLATWKSAGKPFFTVILRDVSKRKQMQRQLEKLYAEEKALRQKLQEEMEMRLIFTRTIVHEMKTPLTPVMASSEMLAEELPQGNLRELALNIHRGACQLNERAEELFDLMRGEAGILEVKPVLLDPLPVLREIANEITPLLSSRSQTLATDLPGTLPRIMASKDRLRQVLLNLLNNAARYTPKHGAIAMRAFEKEQQLVIEIQDNGIGINEEDREWLFSPYGRKSIHNEAGSGLGIGLALCKMIIELHGGKIWTESHVGKGSTFSFSLPLANVPRVQ